MESEGARSLRSKTFWTRNCFLSKRASVIQERKISIAKNDGGFCRINESFPLQSDGELFWVKIEIKGDGGLFWVKIGINGDGGG